MSHTFLCVETPEFMLDGLERVAADRGDALVVVSQQDRSGRAAAWIDADVRSQGDEVRRAVTALRPAPSAVTTTSEMFLLQADALARELGVARNGPGAVARTRDKQLMKTAWRAAGVLTPAGTHYSSPADLKRDADALDYPVIVKPTHGYASVGVRLVHGPAELLAHLRQVQLVNVTLVAKERPEQPGILVEEFVDGPEYSVDTLWQDGVPLFDGVLSRNSEAGPYYPDRLYYLDPGLPEADRLAITGATHAAVAALGVRNGATHTEVRVKGGRVHVLESTSRPGAGGMFYDLFNRAYGIDLHRAYYDNAMGLPVERLDPPQPGLAHFFYSIPARGEGIVKEVRGLDELRARPEVFGLVLFKQPGSMLYREGLDSEYFCCVLGAHDARAGEPVTDYVRRYDDCLEVVV
jgi:biotin carboxylase